MLDTKAGGTSLLVGIELHTLGIHQVHLHLADATGIEQRGICSQVDGVSVNYDIGSSPAPGIQRPGAVILPLRGRRVRDNISLLPPSARR